jgi:ribonuclease-3
LNNLQQKLGYVFKQPALLTQALTHSSYSYEKGTDAAGSNERLEFLGDAVLEAVISEYLFNRFPNILEGELTQKRAALVYEASIADAARECGLGPLLKLGRGEDLSGGRERDSLLSDAMEAVFGAVYFDGGFDAAREVILRLLAAKADSNATMKDYKSQLHMLLQKESGLTADYEVIKEEGPPHSKQFTVLVTHQGRRLGSGTGRSKKEAEQNAAKAALRKP